MLSQFISNLKKNNFHMVVNYFLTTYTHVGFKYSQYYQLTLLNFIIFLTSKSFATFIEF